MPRSRRRYDATSRLEGAERSRTRTLDAARDLFARKGFEEVTITAIADRAGVSTSFVFAQFGAKSGLLRELMRRAIFSARYQAAASKMEDLPSPLEQLRATASVARNIYENEARELGTLRGMSAVSGELRALEGEFEKLRFDMQAARLERLQSSGLLALPLPEARRILWMFTSRDVYRMLVNEGGWKPDRFEQWLADTLVRSLTHSAKPPLKRKSRK